MGVSKRGGRWYLVKRVPQRFVAVDPRVLIRISLHTDSEREAIEKATGVEAQLVSYWEALAAGDRPGAGQRYAAAVRLAEARGFTYRPASDILAGDLRAIVERIEALESGGRIAPPAEVEAVAGLAETPRLAITAGLEEFLRLSADRVIGKSKYRSKKWEDERRNSVASFVTVVGDKDVAEVSHDDAEAFRAHWVAEVQAGKSPNTANRQIGNLSDLFRTLAKRLKRPDIPNHFAGLRLTENKGRRKPARRSRPTGFGRSYSPPARSTASIWKRDRSCSG